MSTDVRVQAFLLCDSVVIDAQTGKPVIQGVFDKVMCSAFPAVHQQAALFARLDLADAKSCRIELSVESPSGIRQQPFPPLDVVAPAGSSAAQVVLQLQGFPLPEEGRYVLGLIVDGQLLSEFGLMAVGMAGSPVGMGGSHGPVH